MALKSVILSRKSKSGVVAAGEAALATGRMNERTSARNAGPSCRATIGEERKREGIRTKKE